MSSSNRSLDNHKPEDDDNAPITSIHPIQTPIPVQQPPSTSNAQKRGLQFWMIFVSLIFPTFLVALDIAAVAIPLPLIVNDLHGQQFEWVGSAYALASTAFQPLYGGVAQVFGRRIVMLTALLFFALGSVVCGSAHSLNVFIIGRAFQGVGAGGIIVIGQIIIGDLVPLQERGNFNGIFAVGYAFANAIGPLVGGALAQHGQWRWLFFLNLPIVGLSALIAVVFLTLRVPKGSFREKIARLDWVGNVIVMGSTTSIVIALTWGGIQFPWGDARVLVPLIVGLAGIVVFIVYEAKVPKEPLVPLALISNRTSVSGYVQCFITLFLILSETYYLPVYYEACKGASLIGAGVDTFGIAQTITPFGFIAGIVITKTGRYRPQLWFAWVMAILGTSLLSTINVDTPRATSIGYQVILGVALGILVPSAVFPVLSALPVSLNAAAFAFYAFVRFFAQIWGVTIGGAALQNRLTSTLPPEFLAQFPEGTAVAYSLIPAISSLPESLQRPVRDAFADGLRVQWLVLVGMSCAGLLVSMLMKGLPLHENVDEEWALEDKGKTNKVVGGDLEMEATGRSST